MSLFVCFLIMSAGVLCWMNLWFKYVLSIVELIPVETVVVELFIVQNINNVSINTELSMFALTNVAFLMTELLMSALIIYTVDACVNVNDTLRKIELFIEE